MLVTDPRISRLAAVSRLYVPLPKNYANQVLDLLVQTDDFDALPEWLQHNLLAVEAAMLAESKLEKHLLGQHDQSTHGHGGHGEKVSPDISLTVLTEKLDKLYPETPEQAHERWMSINNKYDALLADVLMQANVTSPSKLPEEWGKKYNQLRMDSRNEYQNTPKNKALVEWNEGRFTAVIDPSMSFFESNIESEMYKKHSGARAAWVLDDKKTLTRQRALRAGKEPTNVDVAIDEMIADNSILRPTEVYRAANLQIPMTNKLVTGFSFVDKGFIATALTATDPLFYAQQPSRAKAHSRTVLMRAILPKGLSAANVGVDEIVLPRNTTINVLNRDVTKDGIILLDVEYKTP